MIIINCPLSHRDRAIEVMKDKILMQIIISNIKEVKNRNNYLNINTKPMSKEIIKGNIEIIQEMLARIINSIT